MRFIIRGTAVAMAAVVLGASADARTIYHCNQATQHCVNGSLPYNVVTKPPSAADRRGLLKAFDRAHPDRSNLALVGFRVDSPHSAAGYYLITGIDHSTYVSAQTDFFHRTGPHSWVHVKRLKKVNPGWSDAYNLGPGFLWKATGDGSGTYVYEDTQTSDGGGTTWTYNTQASFKWTLPFAKGAVLNLSDDSFSANPSLSGQISAGTTNSDIPQNNASCTGSVNDGHGGASLPDISLAEYPHNGKTQALDFRVDLVDQLSWPSTCSSDWAKVPDDSRFAVGARVPLAVVEHNGFFTTGGLNSPQLLSAQPFDVSVDDLAPMVVSDAQPHRGGTADDGNVTDTFTEDLKLAGTVHFKLVGLYMPLGMLGSPHKPLPVDGKVPPVL